MTLQLIFLGFLVVGLGLIILDRCNKILSGLAWLKECFLINEAGDAVKLPDEFRHFAPFHFLPLIYEANQIKHIKRVEDEEYQSRWNYLQNLEEREMKAFAAIQHSEENAFLPSEDLKIALRRWSISSYKMDIISQWESLFTDTFLALLNGNLSPKEAGKRLKDVSQITLANVDLAEKGVGISDPEIKKSIDHIYSRWASDWESGKLKERLKKLLEVEN